MYVHSLTNTAKKRKNNIINSNIGKIVNLIDQNHFALKKKKLCLNAFYLLLKIGEIFKLKMLK